MATATATAFTGFSFAVCMFAAFAVEVLEYQKSKNRLEKIQEKLQESNLDEDLQQGLRAAERIEQREMAIHEYGMKYWLGCTVAMTAIAVVAFVGLNIVTMGGVSAAILIAAVGGVLTGLARHYWKHEISKLEAEPLELNNPVASVQ